MDLNKSSINVHFGLSFGYHDSAVSVIDSTGNILFAEHEERLSRVKHDNSFPAKALRAAVRHLANNHNFTITSAGYYEVPVLKEARKLVGNRPRFAPQREEEYDIGHIKRTVAKTIDHGDYRIASRIREEFSAACCSDFSRLPINFFEHHASHAAGSFFTSPFAHGSALTLDGAGEFETVTIWDCDKLSNRLVKVWSAELPFSLGLFYSSITSYLGFGVNEGEYKVMGLSAYGLPRFIDVFSRLIHFRKGKVFIDTNYFDFSASADRLFTNKLQELLGIAPAADTAWVKAISDNEGSLTLECQTYCDIACSAQHVLSSLQAGLVDYACYLTDKKTVCMSGGVALNSLANLSTDRSLNGHLYVFPASGDAGSAIGAAYLSRNLHSSACLATQPPTTFNPFLGSDYTNEEYLEAISAGLIPEVRNYDIIELACLADKVEWLMQQLINLKMVALHQGRGEFGPRALGNRSIVASAKFPAMKERLNVLIKKRESYRPYAPAIAIEIASKYFGDDINNFFAHPSHPLRYMASVVCALDEMRAQYPSAIHYDNSARVQVLTESLNPLLHSLSLCLEEHLGCGILLNTSLNLGYEALVGDPISAVNTLTWSCFDAALLGDFAISFK